MLTILLGSTAVISPCVAIILSVIIFLFLLANFWKVSRENKTKERERIIKESSKSFLDQLANYESHLTRSQHRNDLIQLISSDFVPFLLHHPSIKPVISDWEKIYLQENNKRDDLYKRTIGDLVVTFQNLCGDLENIYDDDLSKRMDEVDALVKGKAKEKSSHPLHWRLNSKLQEVVQLSFDKNVLSNETVRKYAKIENKNCVCRIVEFILPPSFKEVDLMQEKLKWKPENDVYVIWEAFKYILNAKETNYMPKSTEPFERWGEGCLLNELNPRARRDNNFPPVIVFTEKFLSSGMQSIINQARSNLCARLR